MVTAGQRDALSATFNDIASIATAGGCICKVVVIAGFFVAEDERDALVGALAPAAGAIPSMGQLRQCLPYSVWDGAGGEHACVRYGALVSCEIVAFKLPCM
jgi:hypothetical protein